MTIKKANSNLTEREAKVLELRKTFSLQEIGDMYGISRERVRQIQKKAEYKLINKERKIKKEVNGGNEGQEN